MKNLMLCFLLFCLNYSFAQSPADLNAVPLEKKEDYKPAETIVVTTANKVLSTPFDQDKPYRLEAARFIMKWMSGTPDYNFSFSADNLKPFNKNEDFMGLYIISMAKFALENPDKAKDDKAVHQGAIDLIINYCNNPDNHLEMTKGLKKISSKRTS